MTGRPYQFVLNDYKTSKRYAEKRIDVPADLSKIIKIWLKHNTSGYFLVSPKDITKPMSSNEITKALQRISAEKFDGKRIGSSMLRHIYLSHKYSDVLKQKQADADKMGHSVAQQNDYVKD